MSAAMDVFRAKDGALVDLPGLQAVAETSGRLLRSYLASLAPELPHLVVFGLEPDGQRPKKNGPPGVMRFEPGRFNLSPGLAILPDRQGNIHTVRIEETQEVVTAEPETGNDLRALVLMLETEPSTDEGGDVRSCEEVRPSIRFVPRSEADAPHILPLAHEMAPKIWATDIARLWRPDHVALDMIRGHMDELEETIWNCDRHGKPWKRQQLGRDWKTYQTKASVAVTSARMALSGRSSTSLDRSRTLTNLHWQLQRSIEKAAVRLEKWVGMAENAGVYSSVFSPFPKDWDAMK